jgi:ADP-ribosylglycohydrolase
MRYSLLSRFQGTLLGATLGASLSGGQGQHQQPSIWGKIAVLGVQSLIKLGRFDREDWRRITKEAAEQEAIASTPESIIATLPLALFSHEYKAKLRQNLFQVASLWEYDGELSDAALAVGYAIAQSLREKLNPATLIPKTIAFLEDSHTPLVQQLEQVQALLEQGAGLEMALSVLRREQSVITYPIALAFYCFLGTPEDYRLSINRAARTAPLPQITCALVGALSGAYNSTAGIPLGWRLTANTQEQLYISPQLTDSLFAVWSGVCDASTSEAFYPSYAIAAPRVIQPR